MPTELGDRITDIYSFIKFLESTYFVPDIILGAIRHRAVNKTDKTPALMEYVCQWTEIDDKQ